MRRVAWLTIVLVTLFVAYQVCAVAWLLLPDKRAFNAMKNRTAQPAPADIDPLVTLDALLKPGDDRARWSQQRAGAVEGLVIRVIDAGVESANCFSLTRVDAHVELAARLDALPKERLIAEVTPPMRDWAARQSLDWSTSPFSAP